MTWFQRALTAVGLAMKPDLIHPILGPMSVDIQRGETTGLWQCWEKIETPRGLIEVHALSPKSGPTEPQIAFFRDVCDRIHDIEADLATFLEAEYFRNWAPNGTRKPLKWIGITLPVNGDRRERWDLTFETNNEAGNLLSVYFKDGAPAFVTVEG
jgi:hypothetical protein